MLKLHIGSYHLKAGTGERRECVYNKNRTLFSIVLFYRAPQSISELGKTSPSVFIILLSLPGASLIAQLVKNPPAMKVTLVRFLGKEDMLEKG